MKSIIGTVLLTSCALHSAASEWSLQRCAEAVAQKDTGLMSAGELHKAAITAFNADDYATSRQSFSRIGRQLRVVSTSYAGLYNACRDYIKQQSRQDFVAKDLASDQLRSVTRCYSQYYVPMKREYSALKAQLERVDAQPANFTAQLKQEVTSLQNRVLGLRYECQGIDPVVRDQLLALSEAQIARYKTRVQQKP
ncbi:MAG: hypothetical protein ACPG4U_13865 [Pseudomonadales bacterium]